MGFFHFLFFFFRMKHRGRVFKVRILVEQPEILKLVLGGRIGSILLVGGIRLDPEYLETTLAELDLAPYDRRDSFDFDGTGIH